MLVGGVTADAVCAATNWPSTPTIVRTSVSAPSFFPPLILLRRFKFGTSLKETNLPRVSPQGALPIPFPLRLPPSPSPSRTPTCQLIRDCWSPHANVRPRRRLLAQIQQFPVDSGED